MQGKCELGTAHHRLDPQGLTSHGGWVQEGKPLDEGEGLMRVDELNITKAGFGINIMELGTGDTGGGMGQRMGAWKLLERSRRLWNALEAVAQCRRI